MPAPQMVINELRRCDVELGALRRRNGALVLCLQDVLENAQGLSQNAISTARGLLHPPDGPPLHAYVDDLLAKARVVASAERPTVEMLWDLRRASLNADHYWADGEAGRQQKAAANGDRLTTALAAKAAKREANHG